MPAPIVVRVGASVDSSVAATFGKIRKSAAQLQGQLNREKNRGVAGVKRAERAKVSAATLSARARRDIDSRRQRAAEQRNQKEVRDFERAERRKTAAAIREAEKRTRAINRAAARKGERFASRTSHRASRFLTPNAPIGSLARRAGSEVLRGVGVDASISSQLSNIVDQEKLATQLSTKAFRPGAKGEAGIRQVPSELRKEARAAGLGASASTNAILQGQFAFTSQSGDLETARKITPELAKLAKSQSAPLEQTFFAAGKINNALEAQPEFMNDTAKRSAAVLDIMKLIIAQTKVGSVEFEKMAVQLPKIAGISGLFGGGTKQSLGQLAAVLQIAEKGQAPNSAVAATQVANLATELQKGAVQRRAEKAGVQLINKETGQAMPMQQIIKSMMIRAGEERKAGNVASEGEFITNIFKNKRTFLPLFDFLIAEKNKAPGDDPGDVVDRMFKTFSKTLGDKQLAEDEAAQRKTVEAKAQRFNTELEKIAEEVSGKLLPALEKAGPSFLAFTEKLGNLTTWVVENPKSAIGAAITASIGRAGLESSMRAGIERLILGPHGGVAGQLGQAAGGGRAGAIGKRVGQFGAFMGITSLAVTTATIGIAIIESVVDEQAKKDTKAIEDMGSEKLQMQMRSSNPATRAAALREDIKRRAVLIQGQRAKESRFNESFTSEAVGQNLMRLFGGMFGDESGAALADREIAGTIEATNRMEAAQTSTKEALLAVLEQIAINTAAGGIISNEPETTTGRRSLGVTEDGSR